MGPFGNKVATKAAGKTNHQKASMSQKQLPETSPKVANFTRKTTYSNRKLPYRALINILLLILIPF